MNSLRRRSIQPLLCPEPVDSHDLGLDNFTNSPQPPDSGQPLLQQNLSQPSSPVSVTAAAARPDNGGNSVITRAVRTLNSSGSAHMAAEMAPAFNSSLNDYSESEAEAAPRDAPGVHAREHVEPSLSRRQAANGLPSIRKCLCDCVNFLKVRKFAALVFFLVVVSLSLSFLALGVSLQCNCNINNVSLEVL